MVSENKIWFSGNILVFGAKTELGFCQKTDFFSFLETFICFFLKNLNISILWIILFISSETSQLGAFGIISQRGSILKTFGIVKH